VRIVSPADSTVNCENDYHGSF